MCFDSYINYYKSLKQETKCVNMILALFNNAVSSAQLIGNERSVKAYKLQLDRDREQNSPF
jgi:hypothetical protein